MYMNAHKNTHAKNTNPPAYYILYTIYHPPHSLDLQTPPAYALYI